ncbi:hypothetical protein Tco_1001873 [Tanacetum coccineum]
MVSFRRLHSHLKLLSNNDLKGTRTESGFKRAFATLFGQDVETFTGTMFLNMDQLEKQLDNEEFQEIGSMAAFKIPEFRDTLIQHMESVKKSIVEREQHKREYDNRVNERQMQTTEEKVNTSKALDASLVDTEIQQHTEHPEFNNEGEEKGFAITALKNELRKLTTNSVNTKFAKSSILGKPALQPRRNQSVVRQPTTFKSERPRFSKKRFAPQVDVNNDLSKPFTTHYLPKERESLVAKPHHMIAPGSSRYSSNDMVHNHYLEEAKKKTQESSRNSEPSVMPSARSQSTWVPTGKIFTSSTTKVDIEPTNGLDEGITNQYEYEQTLDVSAGTLNLSAGMTSDHNSSELGIHDHSNEPFSSKLVPKVVPPADKIVTS